MSGRLVLLAGLGLVAGTVWADDPAPITLSGQGKGPVEVRDSTGEVTEVIRSRDLTLNQMPADAIKREQVLRQEQAERSRDQTAQREQAAAEQAARESEAAKVAEEAAAKAAAEAKAAEEEFDHTPRKVRRKTVRGTRYVATEPVDPTLRTPDNSGIKQVGPTYEPSDQSGGSQSWPPPRPTQQLPPEKPQKQYDPN